MDFIAGSAGVYPLTTTGGTDLTNCTFTWPYTTSTGYSYGYSYTVPDTWKFQIRPVANGFIAKLGYNEYVFTSEKDLAAWLTKELKSK